MENSHNNYQVIAYYYYTNIPNAEEMVPQHLAFCKEIGIRGRIYIAQEGINGTISGPKAICRQYMDELKADPLFSGVEFKIDEHHDHAFNRMHVRAKSEIVHSGLRDPEVIDPTKETGKHLRGEEFLALKDRDDVVILELSKDHYLRGRMVIAAAELQTVEQYEERFAELMTKGFAWLNLSFYGFLDGRGLVTVEFPNVTPGRCRDTSVNFSGPMRAVADTSWDARPHVVLT